MQISLSWLKPGTRFRLAGMPEVEGVLLDCNECSAKVQLDGGPREIEFEEKDGATRRFRARRITTTTWAPATIVEPITAKGNPMAKKRAIRTKTTKTTKAKKAKQPKAGKAFVELSAPKQKRPKASAAKSGDAAGKKLSALDAAAQVLAAKKEPMSAKEMIEAMAAAGLWESPGGKTPDATLYAAIIREIKAKGKEARFKKTDRGRFALAS